MAKIAGKWLHGAIWSHRHHNLAGGAIRLRTPKKPRGGSNGCCANCLICRNMWFCERTLQHQWWRSHLERFIQETGFPDRIIQCQARKYLGSLYLLGLEHRTNIAGHGQRPCFVSPNLSWLTQSGDRAKVGQEPPIPYTGKKNLSMIYRMNFYQNQGLFRLFRNTYVDTKDCAHYPPAWSRVDAWQLSKYAQVTGPCSCSFRHLNQCWFVPKLFAITHICSWFETLVNAPHPEKEKPGYFFFAE
jgi:hypothetical protein